MGVALPILRLLRLVVLFSDLDKKNEERIHHKLAIRITNFPGLIRQYFENV